MTFSSDAQARVEAVARAILEESRSSALVALRFMGPALYAMPFAEVQLKRGAVATDGRRFGFDAGKVVRTFRDNPNEMLRAVLHLVLHCVYRHPVDHGHPRRRWWDVACDVAVGATVLELVGKRFACARDAERQEALDELRKHCPVITAPKLYHAIVQTMGASENPADMLPSGLVERLEELFFCDDHSIWPRRASWPEWMKRSKKRMRATDFMDADDEQAEEPIDEDAGDELMDEEELPDFDLDDDVWEEIAKKIEAGLELFRDKPEFEAGTFTVNLNMANRKRFDYRQFLRRFASLSEEMKTSPDEFDYIYYNYGLTLYDNMPLVEPLEYQETSRVREFVIAIDTSASCSGELVRHFVEKTYNILKSAEGFSSDVNVHIIQCDAEIRDVLKVGSIEDLDAYFANFKMSGLGNTDFRPVFEYVDNAIAAGEFKNLKGIVYLTDGEGTYPSYRPAYDAVFVFVETNPTFITHVPLWAVKAVMDEDQIVEL